MREATKSAVRNMITFLMEVHGLTRVEAYMLCSVAADLRLHEVVSEYIKCFSSWAIHTLI